MTSLPVIDGTSFEEKSIALFLDFDGTLVEIADAPENIIVPDGLPQLLEKLSWRLDGSLAIVSGRAIDVVDRFLEGAVVPIAGLHGWERRGADGHITHMAEELPDLGPARRALSALAEQVPGILLEDKGASIAIHFRKIPELADVCRAAVADVAAASYGSLVALEGKFVIEVKAVVAEKGFAVHSFLQEPPFQGHRPIYLGDDITDESGFAAVNAAGGYGILIGNRGRPSLADLTLSNVTAVHAWLAEIAAMPLGA